MKKIIVASHNPVKLQAALNGFKRMFPDEQFEIEGISAASGVSDQPFSDDETYQGAYNRSAKAKELEPNADYWVGIEGGVEPKDADMECCAWMVIRDRNGQIGKAKAGTFFLPRRVAELIQEGKELGEADDIVFGRSNSKQANGALGLLTGDIITRSDYYTEAIIMALIPFKNPGLYPIN